MPEHNAIDDAGVMVSNRRIRGATAVKLDKSPLPPSQAPSSTASTEARRRALLDARAERVTRENRIATEAISLNTSAPAAASAPTFDPANMREELSHLLESWLDEEVPKYVLRAMDGVSDRMITRIASSAKAKLMPRLLDLIDTAQAAASASAVASVSAPALQVAATSSMETGLQDLIDKIESAQTRLKMPTPK